MTNKTRAAVAVVGVFSAVELFLALVRHTEQAVAEAVEAAWRVLPEEWKE